MLSLRKCRTVGSTVGVAPAMTILPGSATAALRSAAPGSARFLLRHKRFNEARRIDHLVPALVFDSDGSCRPQVVVQHTDILNHIEDAIKRWLERGRFEKQGPA